MKITGRLRLQSVPVANAASRASRNHAERLSRLAAAIRAGAYFPKPSQIADQILLAAAIDVALRNLLNVRG